ncbi:MAG: hypothetical protein HOQ27_10340 [Dermatophilaceae bacterium]|nr:hypothetical protein [Dermatophilaceae bacterium]
MPKQVRVKDPNNGAEFTTNEFHAEAAGLEVLDKPATDDFGRDLPVKYRTEKDGSPASGRSTTTKKES